MQRISIYTEVDTDFVSGSGYYTKGFGNNSYDSDIVFSNESEIDDVEVDDTEVSEVVRSLTDDFVDYLKNKGYAVSSYVNNSTNKTVDVILEMEKPLKHFDLSNLKSDSETFFFDMDHGDATEIYTVGRTLVTYNQTDVDTWDEQEIDVDCIYEVVFDTEIEVDILDNTVEESVEILENKSSMDPIVDYHKLEADLNKIGCSVDSFETSKGITYYITSSDSIILDDISVHPDGNITTELNQDIRRFEDSMSLRMVYSELYDITSIINIIVDNMTEDARRNN